MDSDEKIADLYRDFEEALTDVLVDEQGFGPAGRSRLFHVRGRLHSHPEVTLAEYTKAVDRAFARYAQWRQETKCERCDDTGWTCEAHDDRPWDSGLSEHACRCGAPAIPCPSCNQSDPPDLTRAGAGVTANGHRQH
jgi:hypothetical protein